MAVGLHSRQRSQEWQVTDFFRAMMRPEVLIFLIPLAGIGLGALRLWFNHQERMEKIRHGIDPDARSR